MAAKIHSKQERYDRFFSWLDMLENRAMYVGEFLGGEQSNLLGLGGYPDTRVYRSNRNMKYYVKFALVNLRSHERPLSPYSAESLAEVVERLRVDAVFKNIDI